MTDATSRICILPCLDSDEMAACCRRQLDIPRSVAAAPGRSAVEATNVGHYCNTAGQRVDWSSDVNAACLAKRSIAPNAALHTEDSLMQQETRIQVTNETTLQAARRFDGNGLRPLALNFANGVQPGGGFLSGARAQEEVLCRSGALYKTLEGDPMYEHHRQRDRPDSTDWAIYSPDVPVFRTDDGTALDRPWLLSFLTSAAPYAPAIGQPESGDLLQRRIGRVLAIARAHGFTAFVLGAWGCGAFHNDTQRTAARFSAGTGDRISRKILRRRVRDYRLVAGQEVSGTVS